MIVVAQTVTTAMDSWWDIGQKIGSGAAFVMGVGLIFIWRAYREELAYSKERDKQMLTVMLELTALIQGIEKRDSESMHRQEKTSDVLLAAIADLKQIIMSHRKE